jgi:hypothetical protein
VSKSVRAFTLMVTLVLTAAPALHAERGGTNPHPQIAAVVEPLTTVQLITYTLLSYFGY